MVKQKSQKQQAKTVVADGKRTTIDSDEDDDHPQPETKKGQTKNKAHKKGPRGHDLDDEDESLDEEHQTQKKNSHKEQEKIPQPVKKGKNNKAQKKNQPTKGHFHDDSDEEVEDNFKHVGVEGSDDEEEQVPQPVKKGKNNKAQKKNQPTKGHFHDDSDEEVKHMGHMVAEDDEEEVPQPVKKGKKNKVQKKNQQSKWHSNIDDESEEEVKHMGAGDDDEEEEILQPVQKAKNNKAQTKKHETKARFDEDLESEEEVKHETAGADEEISHHLQKNTNNKGFNSADIAPPCPSVKIGDAPPLVETVADSSLIDLQQQVESMDIKDASNEEQARKKAEKEARKLRKAQKEAAKREKNLELIKSSQGEKVDGQERTSEDQEDDEGILYGAPDDVAWTDKSAAMLEAEKLNKNGPDLSLIYGADGKKLSNKERKKLQKDREAAERAEEVEKAAAKASAEGAQFACSQTAFSENDPQWQNSLDINIPSFNISAAGKILFKDSPFVLSHGRRAGLVGPNGRGKSTLLKMINSRDLRLPPRIDYLYVEQEVVADETPAVEAVLKADKIRWNLMEEETFLNSALDSGDEDPKKLARLQKVYEELSAIGADSAEAKARRILYGLGFDLEMQTKPTKMFSGGWRMRISLARALFMEPTLLMLDEPTNHLDLNAVIWLDDYLQRWKKTLLIVSHDQDFLNSVCEEVIHIEDLKLVTYKGDYDTFKKAQAIKMKDQIKNWEKQEKRLRELKRSGQSKAKATESVLKSAKREPGARSQKKANDDIASGISTATAEELLKRPKEYAVKLEFAEVPELARPVLEVSKVHFRYSPKFPIIFNQIEFGIDMDSRITVVGPNGAGKSTLLKLLTGEVDPTTGEVRRNPRLRMGIYNQHFVDRLPMTKTPVEHLRDRFQEEDYQSIRNRLGKYGLEGHAHEVVMRDLSGGQKARVVFVELSLQRPHILLLDEPTNNLDIETIDALIDAINEFNGGVVVVTHDQRLIEKCECDLWVVDKQRVIKWEAGFDDYKESLLKEMEEAIEKESADRKEKIEQIAAERADKLARLAEKLKSKQK